MMNDTEEIILLTLVLCWRHKKKRNYRATQSKPRFWVRDIFSRRKLVYDDDKSFCIHHQNIKTLLIEIYKAFHDNSRNSLKELFVKRKSTINLRSKPELMILLVNSPLDKHSLRYFGFLIWDSLLIEIREDNSILSFVTKIK